VRRALLPLLLCLAGCTLEPGQGFATLERGELRAELARGGARDLGDDAVLTDLGYHVRLARARVHVGSFTLLELLGSTAAESSSFDPAHPPAGYTLCHGGHCHAEDGSLHSYEEVQAALAGGSVSFEPVVSMEVGRGLDLLRAASAPLDGFAPSAELPRSTIDRAELQLERLEIEATVSEGELEQPVELALDLPLSERLSQTLGRSIDRDGKATLRPRARLRVPATLFDGLDFAGLAAEASIAIEEGSESAGVLIESLLGSGLEVTL